MENIKLIKRYKYDRDNGRDGDEWVHSRWNYITSVDLFEIKRARYAVKTYLHDYYHFDISDDHGTSVEYASFTVVPLTTELQPDEETVINLLRENEKSNTYRLDISIYESSRFSKAQNSGEALTEYIEEKLPDALNALITDKKLETLRCTEDNTPNAVHVSYSAESGAKHVYDFDSDYALGQMFYPAVSKVVIREAPASLARRFGINRRLCWIQRESVSSGTLHNYRMTILLDTSVDGDMIICGYDKGRPCALTPDEVDAIVKDLNEYSETKWY